MSIIEGSTKEFGNTSVLLHSLGSSCYRIEWYSRMTGASTSLAKLMQGKYVVIRKWAQARNMSDVSSEFNSRNSALIHFLNNVDIVKSQDEWIIAAKQHCLNLFVENEGLKPVTKASFPKPRLQGAIGKEVVVKSKVGEKEIAHGLLLQLVGNQAEIQLMNTKKKYYSKQVYIR
ncbi:hypothetical protein ACN9JF_02305 [Pseudoalteromonas lipolytica]|jgi:hypothetical protein|uniref:hypothetical protein n=1 Tax=Pseudoalteromonas lipolytica TaxID=570156 RepID=UPI003B9E1C1C